MVRYAILAFALSFASFSANQAISSQEEFSAPFFSVKEAGRTAEVVAPDFISAEHKAHSTISFSADGTEAVWSAFFTDESRPNEFDQRIFITKFDGKQWSTPVEAPFAAGHESGGPGFIDNGQSIVFSSYRPLPTDGDDSIARLWITTRDGDNWTEPKIYDSQAPALRHTNLVSVSQTGTVYFGDRIAPAAPNVFRMSRDLDGHLQAPEVLPGQINSRGPDFDAWIDPQERFLLFTSMRRVGGLGAGDLYISLPDPGGKWGPAISLGSGPNSSDFERFASVAPDGRTFFFVRARGQQIPGTDHSFYRMDFEVILNSLGYNLLNDCDPEQAVEIMQLCVDLFPDSWNAWDSLADAYKHTGNREGIVAAYERALELNPGNPSSTWGLKLVDRSLLDQGASTDQGLIHEPGKQTGLKGPYLGQSLPGMTPELFAPGIISICGRFEYNPTFSSDGKELFFSTNRGLMVCRLEEAGWTAPERAGFSGFEPHITLDGSKMYIGRGLEIWVLEKTENGWSNDRKVCNGMRPFTDAGGNLYVTEVNPEDGSSLLVVYRPTEDGFQEMEILPDVVNVPKGGAHPCVSNDGKLMIFDSYRTDENHPIEYGDFFVTRLGDNNKWSTPIRLPDTINTPGENICATLSRDGKYLFFSGNSDMYWVDARVLDQ